MTVPPPAPDAEAAQRAARRKLCIGALTFDAATGALTAPSGTDVVLRPKSAEVLRHLVERIGEVVPREALMEAVWPGIFVTDDSLTQCIAEIRRALGEEGARRLRTLPKRGYMLMAADSIQAVAAAGAAAPDEPLAAERVTAARAGPVRRVLSVLVCRLDPQAGTTPDPEDLREAVLAAQHAATAVIERLGGVVIPAPGLPLTGWFGWLEAQEDHAERAARAALGIMDASKGKAGAPVPLLSRLGIATGEVVLDAEAHPGQGLSTVTGQAPGRATALATSIGGVGICLDQTTRRLVGGLFECDAIPGEGEPVFRLLGEGRTASRLHALRHPAAWAPLTGRDEPLEMLMRRWARARDGEGQVVLVSGEAGIGKSRLLAAFLEAAQREGVPFEAAEWSCAPHQQDNALDPVLAWLRRRCGIAARPGPEQGADALRTGLDHDGLSEEDLRALAGLLAAGPAAQPPAEARRQRAQATAALLRWAAAAARRRPLLLTLEDAHWADPSTRDLLDLLAARAEDSRLLLLVTHREEFCPTWAGLPQVTELRLSRLPRRATRRLVEALAGADRLPPAVLDAIARRCDGIPLHAEELTRAVLEAGEQGTVPPAIPATLSGLLLARLDRVGREALAVAQAGAAIGREFERDILAAAAALPGEALDPLLERLAAAGLVLPRGDRPDGAYAFRHALLQDAAYGTLLRNGRRALHARIADALPVLRPGLAEREPHLLAQHCAAAGRAAEAARLWTAAGRDAAARWAPREACAHLENAVVALDLLPEGEVRDRMEFEAQLLLAQTSLAANGYSAEATGRAFRRAADLAARVRKERRAELQSGGFLFALVRGPLDEAARAALALRDLGRETSDPSAEAMGERAIGTVAFFRGDQAGALAHLGTAIGALSRGRAGPPTSHYVFDHLASALILRALARQITGDADGAARDLRRAEARAAELAATATTRFVLHHAACLDMLRDDACAALCRAEALLRLVGQDELPIWLSAGQVYAGWARATVGGLAEGAATAAEGVRRWRAMGASLWVSCYLTLLARARRRTGDLPGAAQAVEEATALALSNGDRFFLPETHREAAAIARARGDVQGAARHLAQAIDLARGSGARLFEARAAADLAASTAGVTPDGPMPRGG